MTSCLHRHFNYYLGFCFGQGRISTDIVQACGLVFSMLMSHLYSLEFRLSENQNGIFGFSHKYSFLITS